MTPVTRLARNAALAILVTAAGLTAAPRPAVAYQIDCAILLCLAGGFPPSEPCARARAEMIRRIMPWPVEPPLQLWRCPMRAEFMSRPPREEQVIEATVRRQPPTFVPPELDAVERIWQAFGEDVTDYVMAIKVYDLTYRRHRNRDGDCNEWGSLRMGTYDQDWNFSWLRAHHNASPAWFFSTSHTGCSSVWFRGVGMEWRDHEGKAGTEVVRY